MTAYRPSRRQLLLGALAGFFCWRATSQARPAPPRPRRASAAPRVPHPRPGSKWYCYDAHGRLRAVGDLPPGLTEPLLVAADNDELVSSYSCCTPYSILGRRAGRLTSTSAEDTL
jgi:hypothetical protein